MGEMMKKLTVTLEHLEERRNGLLSGTSIKFRVIQSGKVLVEDMLSGKASSPFTRVYEVDATDGDLVVEHNRQDLPWLTVIAAFERSVGTYGSSMYIGVNDDKGTTREKLSAIAARYMVGEATESTEELVSEVMELFDKYETRRLIDSCIKESIMLNCRPGGLIWQAIRR